MQKQQIISNGESDLSSNLNKQHSRSVRRLYNRMGNNIRVLNKSKVSNRSNNSIGSVALRRTQLSNDKIYSREEEFMANDSRQIDFDSEMKNVRISFKSDSNNKPENSLLSSNNNSKNRQRINLSKQAFSRRSSSSKTYRDDKILNKKPTKYEIEKLLMMEDQRKNQHEEDYTKQFRAKQKKQYYGQKNCKDYDFINKNSNNSKFRENQNIKSSMKSKKSQRNLLRQSKDSINRHHHQVENSRFETNEMKRVTKKYQEYQQRPSQYQISKKFQDHYSQKQKILFEIKSKQKDYQYRQTNRNKQKQNVNDKLHKYKSEKHFSTNDSEIMQTKRQTIKNSENNVERYYDQKQQKKRKNQEKYHQKISSKQHYFPLRNPKPQNSLEKYQREHRRHVKENQKNISEKFLFMESSLAGQDRKYKKQDKIYEIQNKNYNRERQGEKRQDNNRQRSSILQLKSKNGQSQFRKDIRIRQKEYAYLYREQQSQIEDDIIKRRSSKKFSYKTDHGPSRLLSPRTPKHYNNNEYYTHMITPTSAASSNKNNLWHKNSPTTQISSTFDSLILSINSHITISQNQQSSASFLIEKLNLHIKTLQIIKDYSKQFKKMYQDIEQWEQLIFLSFKKYWVQKVKVIEYLKKFIVPSKRHSNQKLNLKMSLGNKCTKDQALSSPLIDDPFSSNTLLQNPFTIPFCKLSDEQISKLCRSQQGPKLLGQLQQQTASTYKQLQQLYNQFITKCHNPNMNMLYCDNFSDQIYLEMLAQIQKLLPNLQQFKVFEVTKIRLGKIVKTGILVLHINGKYVRNISQIVMFDDCQKIGDKKKIKAFTTYDLYYEVFQKMVVQ